MIRKLRKFDYVKPKSVAEVVSLLKSYQEKASLLAGGTDLMVFMKLAYLDPKIVIDLKGISSLDFLSWDPSDALRMGNLATLHSIIRHPLIREHFPILVQAGKALGHPQIRTRATVAGSICTASPSGDMAPSLLALGARVKVASPAGERTLPIQEMFKGPFQTVLSPTEVVTEIHVPALPHRSAGSYCWQPKITAVDETLVGAAAVVTLADGDQLREVGQGSETVLCQIAAEELGVPLVSVSKATPDTAVTPFDESTTSSRSTSHMGNAVKMAAADARQQILNLASKTLEANPDDLEMRDGNVRVKGVPEKALSIAQVLSAHYGSSGTILGKGFYYPREEMTGGEYSTFDSVFWMYCAQGAEVEVDPHTGRVKVLRMVAAHDTGTAVNPANCIQQIAGALSFGLGFTFYEDLIRENGKTQNPSLMSYKIPTSLDMVPLEAHIVEGPYEAGPFGAKAVGEPATVPTAAAIANAVADAIDVRIKDLPITPDKIFAALKEKVT